MPGPVVLTVGSLHHDIMVEADHLPRRDETAVGRRWYPKFGGKGGNQAVAVARAGVASRFYGAVGADGFGDFLTAGLAAGGVEAGHVAVLEGVGSGMSVAILDAAGDYGAVIVSGANLAIPVEGLGEAALWEGVALLILQNEVPEAVNLAAARAARARGVRVVLNAAPAREMGETLAGLIDLLVVNAVEAEMLGGGGVASLTEAEAAAARLAARFAGVIVTAGGLGCAGVSGAGRFAVAAERVKVVSTHGAGDAFIGALAAALVRGAALEEAARAASAAAARHVAGAAG